MSLHSKSFFLLLAILFFAAVSFSQTTIIASGSLWKYFDKGANLGTAWYGTSYSDAAWASGNAQLGYGDGDESTTVKYGASTASRYITTYFRKTIAAFNDAQYSSYTLNVKRDDGVIMYVNGVEKFRNNMPAGTVAYNTLASTTCTDDGNTWQTISLPAGLLINGNNIIAAEIHQCYPNNSDISFDLELKANTSTDITPPVLTSSSPAYNAANISSTASVIAGFNEDVKKGSGNIFIKESGVIKQTISVSSAAIIVSGKSITIDPADFTAGALVNIELPVGVLKDMAGNNFAGITGSAALAFSVAAMAPVTTLTRGPYLQMGTANSIVIRWRTAVDNDSRVYYGTAAGSLTSVVNNTALVTNHEIQLTGLAADTKYYYSIGSSAQILQGDAENYFTTAPVVGTEKKVRVWVNGDCGDNSTNQKNVLNQYLGYNGSNYTNVWLLLGDNAYNSGFDDEYQSKFFDVYKTKMLRQTVLWPTPGNHDYDNNSTRANDHAIPYYDIFTLPAKAQAGGVASGTEAYYSFNYANVHFVSLDSYGKDANTYRLYDTLGPQVVWLKKDLAANTQRWTIIYWHHPPYTMGSHNSDTESELVNIRQNFIKILERYKVDMVLCGHSHNYERTKLIKGYYGNEASFKAAAYNLSSSSGKYDGSGSSCPYAKNSSTSYSGTVYVVAGSSGRLSAVMQASYPHAAMHYSDNTTGGSISLEIEANRLDAKWVCADGSVKDKFTLVKDVSIKKNISITKGNSISLNASWIGNYNWTGGATTRSIKVTPAASATYIVKDAVNCLADTFIVSVTLPRPSNLKSNITQSVNTNDAMRIYPNPSSGETTIEYRIDTGAAVSLDITDITGKKIKTLVHEIKNAGVHTYALHSNSLFFKEGMYIVKLTFGTQNFLQKLIIKY